MRNIAALASLALLASPVAAQSRGLTVKTGESWMFAISRGQPVRARKVAPAVKPSPGHVLVSLRSMMGTSLSITSNKAVILFLINIVFLITGCLMESIAAIILLVPIFLPLTKNLGVDPVHLGLIICLNLSIGFVTPPVGASLFIIGGLTKLSIDKIARACFPFIVVNILILFWLTYTPGIVMWLPRLVFK